MSAICLSRLLSHFHFVIIGTQILQHQMVSWMQMVFFPSRHVAVIPWAMELHHGVTMATTICLSCLGVSLSAVIIFHQLLYYSGKDENLGDD